MSDSYMHACKMFDKNYPSKLFLPTVTKQATGIYSLPQLLHQLWCLGKSAQLRSDWKFGLLHLVKLRYTLSKVIYPNYYKRFFHFSLK